MNNLILVRHGRTEYNEQKRFTGFTDVDIVAAGQEDARLVAQKMSQAQAMPTMVYTSWLKRAWQTLEILEREVGFKVPVTKHPFLNERHYGELQGKLHEEIAAQYGVEQVQLWRRSYNVRPPNGECLADVVFRVQHYYEQEIFPQLRIGNTVLVCAHGNALRAMVMMLENISETDIVAREIAFDEPLFYTV